jgi:hypothetical protein
MTRRSRITTVEEADSAMERLGWIRAQGSPNAAVRELWDVAVAYRAAVHRQSVGEEKKPGWQERVTK